MEKIKNIEIQRFKSIKDISINNFNKVNVFIGMPNAGKSNILEAIGLLGSLTVKKNNLKFFVRYKDFSELFFEGEYYGNFASIESQNTSIFFSYNDELNIYEKELKTSRNYKYLIENNGNMKMVRDEQFSSSRLKKASNIFKYEFDKNSKSFFSTSKNLIHPYGENIGQIISSNPKLRKEVNEFFNQNGLKLLIDKSSNELKIFKEYQDGTVFTLPYTMIADTLQRLIFYKAAIMSNKESVLLFEEPEAHCFEPYILEFTNDVKFDKNDNQFFIVTHSDFIIQEFLRDEESKNNTNIYLVNNVDGETKVKLLDKKKNDDVYELGMNAFFNFETLWENN